jgi:G3E family GTPase
LRANHKDKKWQGIVINRASFVTSYSILANELGLTISQIRTSINKLKSTGEIAHKSHNKYGIITILKYDNYQVNRSQDSNDIADKSQANSNKQQINKTTNKQDNKRDAHGSHVKLTREQFDSLIIEYGLPLITTIIDRMNEYIGMKGKPYKDYNLAIRKWIREQQTNNPKWLPELKAEQDAQDAIEYKPKRSAEEAKEKWDKL